MTAKIVSEYDQEIPQSQTADNSMAPKEYLKEEEPKQKKQAQNLEKLIYAS